MLRKHGEKSCNVFTVHREIDNRGACSVTNGIWSDISAFNRNVRTKLESNVRTSHFHCRQKCFVLFFLEVTPPFFSLANFFVRV